MCIRDSLSTEAIVMYKYFIQSELKLRHPTGRSTSQEIDPDLGMGLIGKVDETRKRLEDLFNTDNS